MDKDKRPEWHCFVCGKYLGQQGSGGDFTHTIGPAPEAVISFGFGSSFDEGWFGDDLNPHKQRWEDAPHIAGWICDECIVARHERLKVRQRRPDHEERGWDEKSEYTPLAEHPSTKRHIEEGGLPDWAIGHKNISSTDRAAIMDTLDLGNVPEPRLVGALLAALAQAEIEHDELRLRESKALRSVLDRMRQNAELLTAEEVADLRARESDLWPRDETRLQESVAWYEDKWNTMSDAWNDHLRELIQISGEKADGHPVLRGTETPVADVLRSIGGEHKLLLEALASYFDRSFMEIMMMYAERGYVRKYFEETEEARQALLKKEKAP